MSNVDPQFTVSDLRFKMPLFWDWWKSIDRVLLSLFLSLLAAGLMFSMAASPAASAKLGIDNPFHFFIRHGLFVSLGLAGALVLSFFSPLNARRLGVLALVGGFVLMLVVFLVGDEVKGAKRWIRIGGFGLQPSEFVKPAFIVFAAWMFSVKRRDPNVPVLGIVFAVYAVLIALLIKQPDFGQSFLLTCCFAAVFFFAGISLGWLVILMGLSALGVVGAYMALPHVRDRVSRFLDPSGDRFQTNKALDAISHGGFLGRGPGEGAIKYSIPDGHTDFIFAVIVEEFGFLISSLLIFLLCSFVVRAYRNALRLNDYFSQLAVAGLASLIGMQMIINLYVNLNMAPPKGMTLPFISSGGSSMLSLCFTTGLILAFTRRRAGAYGYEA